MRRTKNREVGSNFWPGYVDALVNVVLNLLFLVAVLAISAAVMSASRGRNSPEPSPNFAEHAEPPSVEKPSFDLPPKYSEVLPSVEKESRSTQHLPTSVPTEAPSLTSFQIVDARRTSGASLARITSHSLADGQVFIIDLPQQADPLEEMARPQIQATLQTIAPVLDGHEVKLWSYTADTELHTGRPAYRGLASLRNALLTQGWSPHAVGMRLTPGLTPQNGNLRLYMFVRKKSADERLHVATTSTETHDLHQR